MKENYISAVKYKAMFESKTFVSVFITCVITSPDIKFENQSVYFTKIRGNHRHVFFFITSPEQSKAIITNKRGISL